MMPKAVSGFREEDPFMFFPAGFEKKHEIQASSDVARLYGVASVPPR